MNNFMKFIGGLVVLVAAVVFSGYALSILWGWFIVALFGLPALGISQAMGVSLVVSYMTHQVPPKTEKERSFGEEMLLAILKPLFALGVGWIILQFI